MGDPSPYLESNTPNLGAIRDFNARAATLAESYESVTFEEVHSNILDWLPPSGARVLDVGAGSGRDAAALASRGLVVVAVEPAARMLTDAKLRHERSEIEWVQDKLPALTQLNGQRYHLVLLSAVWMFIPPAERLASMRRVGSLLADGGVAVLDVLPEGPARPGFHPTSLAELEEIAMESELRVIRRSTAPDALGRAFEWTTLVLRREG